MNKKELAQNLLISFAAILFFFLLFEIFLRATMGEYIQKETYSDGSWEFRPNQNGWIETFFSGIKINSLGCRGQEVDFTSGKRALFLGDSFVFGWLLSEKQTIPYFFELASEQKIKTCNASAPGYGIGHMASKYKRFPFKPDITIITLITYDFFRPMDPAMNSSDRVSLRKIIRSSSAASFMLNTLNFSVYSPQEIVLSEEIFTENNKKKIIELTEEIKKDNSVPVFVFYEYEKTKYSIEAEKFCKDQELTCITDVYSFFSGMTIDDLTIKDKAHPSALANKIFAAKLLERINSLGLIQN